MQAAAFWKDGAYSELRNTGLQTEQNTGYAVQYLKLKSLYPS